MARILRGDLWWADLDPVRGHEQAGKRPVLVISHDILNKKSGTVIALAVTSKEPRAGYPLSQEIKSEKMPKDSWVKMTQVRTLSTQRLRKKIGRVSAEELEKILEGFCELIR